MPLKQQVCSLELSKKLKEQGVKQESIFWWVNYSSIKEDWDLKYSKKRLASDFVSAFTVAELGEMLPEYGCETMKVGKSRWRVTFPCELWEDNQALFEADTEADARAKCLVYLLENKLI